jgi:quinol-cytochrome oxidoreductase complex cytochrome b subunit/mono/diheme cytochrome c family protein
LFKHMATWLDERIGSRNMVRGVLDEPIPGGPRWRYALGSAVMACVVIEAVTGLILMLNYSPSTTTAWGSVYYIHAQVGLGWFIRGLHRFGAYAMVVLLVLHLIQTAVAGAYRAPREANWWIGVFLLLLTLGFGVTGNILHWDQHGFWAAKVETVIAGGAPVIGPSIERLAVGGTNLGNLTLTRIYGLHVGVLPVLFTLLVCAHIALIRRHGLTPPRNVLATEPAWPRQSFYRVLAYAAVFAALAAIVIVNKGTALGSPADPASEDFPARPEWYFLWLFQMLKYFHGEREVIATVIIPGALMTVLLLLPLFDKVLPGKIAHFLACTFVFALVGGAGSLTYLGFQEDAKSEVYLKGRKNAEWARSRAFQLAGDESVGIPPEGPAYLLGRDPLYHGGGVFEKKCQGCHPFGDQAATARSAPNLKGYGTRAWVRGLLENPDSETYFGKVANCEGMSEWKKRTKLTSKQLDDVADYVATFANIDFEITPDEWAAQDKLSEHPGRKPFQECLKCHTMGDVSEEVKNKKEKESPDLFAYNSTRWTARMIRNPNHPKNYGHLEPEQKMPVFASQLTDDDLTTLVRYLKGDYLPALSPKP